MTIMPDEQRPARGRLFAAGALTGAAGLAVSELVTTVLHGDISPVIAVAQAVRDLTPGAIALPLIHLVKHLDKPLLVTGSLLVVLLGAGLAGIWVRRHPGRSQGMLMLLALLGLGAVLKESETPFPGTIAIAAGAGTWFVILPLLTRAVTPHVPSEEDEAGAEPPSDRRRFLLTGGGVAAGSALAFFGSRVLGQAQRQVAAVRRTLRLPVSQGVPPANAELGVKGIQPWATATDSFYRIDTSFAPPQVDPTTWKLRIHGMVDREVVLTYDQLIKMKFTQAWLTLCCVSNPVGGDLISNAWFSGVPVRELLAMAGPQAGADAVLQTSVDGWNCGTPLAAMTDKRNALLAVAMNGEPLPVEHGFPARVVVPGLYGYVSGTKWVIDWEVTTFSRFQAYWTQRGWSAQGPVKTQSRIDVPSDGAKVPAGRVHFGGSAWAQHTGIRAVEFQVDGGPWQQAELGGVPDNDTWVQWAGAADLPPGSHRVVVRATDKSGYSQTAVRTDVVPNGASGWDTIQFTTA